MPTQAQIERSIAAVPAGEAGDLIDVNRRIIAEAVLAAAAPTPEEHERGIEAAAEAMEREMFADHELPLDAELHGKYRHTAHAAIRAYLAATGGANG